MKLKNYFCISRGKKFIYKTEEKSGFIYAKDEIDANKILESKNVNAVEIKKSNLYIEGRIFLNDVNNKLNNEDIAFFSDQIAFIIESGIDLKKGLAILDKRFTGKLQGKIKIISCALESGKGFSESLTLAKGFPYFFVSMVKIGENSDKLLDILKSLTNYYNERDEFRKKIRNSMLYPSVVMSFMVIAILVSIFIVMPNYADLYNSYSVELPTLTKYFMNTINFFVENAVIINIVFIILLLYVRRVLKNNKKRFHECLLHVPIIKDYIIKEFNFFFAETIALLLKSGLTMDLSLLYLKDSVENEKIKDEIELLVCNIREGKGITTSMEESDVFLPILYTSLAVAMETGQMENSLEKIGTYLRRELILSTKKAEKTIEIGITIFLGIILGFILISMMLPTFYLIGGY
ncbi:MAG: type II secretion system F family protein [Lachnospirales bacterium]